MPTMRYRDVPAAVRWLCRAFGMKVHRIVPDADGAPRYAELTVGSGMLIVAPIEDTPLGRLMVQPDDIGGVETQVCYLYVANPHRHFARAKAAGAAIVLDIEDEANRGRGYSCRDPEGHVWNFGTYDPWQTLPHDPHGAPWGLLQRVQSWDLRYVQRGVTALSLLALAAVLLAQAMPQPSARAGTALVTATPAEELRPGPEPAPAKAAPDPEAERRLAALQAAEQSAAEARSQLAEVRGALAKAERDASVARAQLEELQQAKLTAERAAADARVTLAAAQKEAERARAAAELERDRRVAATRAAMVRAWRRHAMRRVAPARSWCYSSTLPNPPTNARGRLIGFCKS